MEIIIQYPTVIEEWRHEDINKFIGHNSMNLNHDLGITHQDANEPECCYFNVWVKHEIDNSTNGIVFSAITYSCFKVRNNNQVPNVEFYFDLICRATHDFAIIFYHRTKKTNLEGHKIPVPVLDNLRDNIQNCIDIWNKTTRNISLN